MGGKHRPARNLSAIIFSSLMDITEQTIPRIPPIHRTHVPHADPPLACHAKTLSQQTSLIPTRIAELSHPRHLETAHA
jgi:hypothetical protein